MVEAGALRGRAPVPRPDLMAAEILIASQGDADPRGDPAQLPTGARVPLGSPQVLAIDPASLLIATANARCQTGLRQRRGLVCVR